MAGKKSFTTQYKVLTEALLSDKGLQHLTETAHSVFACPVMIVDSSYRFLASAYDAEQSKDKPKVYEYLTNGDISKQSFLDKKGVESLKADKIPEILSKKMTPVAFHHSVLECECIAIGVRLKSMLVAYIILIRQEPLSSDEEKLLSTFRDLVCQELQKNKLFQSNRDEYISYLLIDLLNNKYPDEETIRKRLSTVDFEPAHHMCVVVIRKRKEDEPLPSMEMVLNQIRGSFTGHLYAAVEHAVVLLLNFKEDKKLDERLLNVIDQTCENNDLIAGISNEFKDLEQLTRQYRLATRAALVCQRYVEGHRIIYYDDVFDLALLEYCDRHNDLMDFVHSSIINLYEHDQQYGTDYLYTFWVYTENACNTNATAAKMFIHKNTLAYRLTKIKEILGSDLTSGKDMFAFQLSMRILRMLGKLEKEPVS